jgi:hypothetical protein
MEMLYAVDSFLNHLRASDGPTHTCGPWWGVTVHRLRRESRRPSRCRRLLPSPIRPLVGQQVVTIRPTARGRAAGQIGKCAVAVAASLLQTLTLLPLAVRLSGKEEGRVVSLYVVCTIVSNI